MSDEKKPLPKIRPISQPMDVPVFNIVIHVSETAGKTKATVVNLPDLSFEASSEPMALKKAITEVKSRLANWHGKGEPIPWIELVPEPASNEQQRLVPVHL